MSVKQLLQRAVLFLQGGLWRAIRFTPVSKFLQLWPSLWVVSWACGWLCVLLQQLHGELLQHNGLNLLHFVRIYVYQVPSLQWRMCWVLWWLWKAGGGWQLHSEPAGGICFVFMPFCRGDFQSCFLHHKMLRKLAVNILWYPQRRLLTEFLQNHRI